MEKWSCERVVPIAIPSGNPFLLLPFLLSPPISLGHRHAPTDSLYAVSSDPPPACLLPGWLRVFIALRDSLLDPVDWRSISRENSAWAHL